MDTRILKACYAEGNLETLWLWHSDKIKSSLNLGELLLICSSESYIYLLANKICKIKIYKITVLSVPYGRSKN
jgi:hypothetical protein